ncbi:MAG: molybdopterin molybdotransferase MoeA [Coriobacteriales bacterium]|jgi:molybdopterin molybdotransferase|nr:molybdopterin molybdotransferase MoeA [Coriobacteriales bacterium]
MGKRYASTNLVAVEDALAMTLSQVRRMPVEEVEPLDSYGRVLARDIASDIDLAPFASSSMDGFAVRAKDLVGAEAHNPAVLEIVGVIGAGSVFDSSLHSGQALRIMTGAPLPDGADSVVKIEDCKVSGESTEHPAGIQVLIPAAHPLGENVRGAGEEARAGEVLLHAGEVVNAAGVGLLASTGHTRVAVYARPRVAVFSSGDELVEFGEVPGPGQIRNSNTLGLAAQARAAGAKPTVLPKVNDNPEAFLAAFAAAVRDHDMVVISGGAAEGDYDYTTSTIRQLGEVFFNKVNMKPGKAQTLGQIDGVPVFGLPGNPAAAAVGFEVLVRPALRQMQGFSQLQRPISSARTTQAIKKSEDRRHYLRARLNVDAKGQRSVTPFRNQSSALLRALYEGNCLLIVAEGPQDIAVGEQVPCLRLDLPEGALL